MTRNRAMIWDYDGTLVDTRRKNWQVTRSLIPDVSGRPLDAFPALASPETYWAADRRATNWREFYRSELGLSAEQVKEAGRLWTAYQMANDTPTPFFDGIAAVLATLNELPQAIFSQNSRQAILRALDAVGLRDYFGLVIGYEELDFERHKPAPDGLLLCLERLGVEYGTAFYVGDHDVDMTCAKQCNESLRQQGSSLRVVSIGAMFGEEGHRTWNHEPDFVARHPEEVAEQVANGLW